MKKIITFLFTAIILVGCKNESKKEKFSYKRVQEATENTIVKSMNDVTINSNDQMLFDRAIIRVKANKYVQTPTLEQHEYHQDFPFKHKAAIFYVNTNNGQTQFVDTTVDSVENSMLRFDASVEHRSTTTTDTPYRININFNYF